MTEIDDARYRRLVVERNELRCLSMISPFIEIEPIETQPGWPPEEYEVTYTCRGIVGVDDDRRPIYGERHRVAVRFAEHFPMQEPYLLWLTPIWHPNIRHREPRRVCTDEGATWFAGKKMTEIVILMGEMVQYKLYHAGLEAPFPEDREVAEWVREYAEPRGLVGPGNPVDGRELLNRSIYIDSVKRAARQEAEQAATQPAANAAPSKRGGMIFGTVRDANAPRRKS
jgi:ubiquitin-protein ligase